VDATFSYGKRLKDDEALTAATAMPGDSEAPTMEGVPASPSVMAGMTVTAAGRFRLRRIIGRGGMGVVWEAEQLALGRSVAVKSLNVRDSNEDLALDRARQAFHLEAFVAGRLEHPNIVPVHDLATDNEGNPLLAMKLVRGEPWNELLRRDFNDMEVPLFLARHLPILAQMAHAVSFAHSQRIVHRDLKPSQVMIGEYGEVLLTDWGLAVHLDTESQVEEREAAGGMQLPSVTNASNPSGTPAMMAPEQTLASPHLIGPWTDVFLLGGTLYHLLTGAYPYQGGTSEEAFLAAMNCRFPPPSERAPARHVPAELESLCLEAMRGDIPARLASAKEFVARLQDYLSGASRRRESEELSSALAREFHAVEADIAPRTPEDLYAVHESLGERLARAMELWPGNDVARGLQAAVLAARARHEIAFGDLLQARVHLRTLRSAEFVGHAPEVVSLDDALTVAERDRERARRQRVLLMRAAAVLFIGMLGASGWAFMAQRRAEAQSKVAMSRADVSAGLTRFLLNDLGEALDPNVPRDEALIAKITTMLTEHYESVDLTDNTPEMIAAFADEMATTGEALRKFGRSREAVPLIERAVKLLDGLHPTNEGFLARALIYHGATLGDMGEYGRALKATERAEKVLRPLVKPADPAMLKVRTNRAATLYYLGRHDEAMAEFRAILPLMIASEGGRKGEETRKLLGMIGGALRSSGDYEEAVTYIRDAIEIAERIHGPEGEAVADEIHRLALVYLEQDRPAEAMPLIERGYAISLKHRGPNHPGLAQFTEPLATAAMKSADYAKAEQYLKETARLLALSFGEEHAKVLKPKSDLSRVYWSMGRREEGLAMAEAVVAAYPDAPGGRPDALLEMEQGLLFMYVRLGVLDKARELSARLLPKLRELRGPRHRDVADALSNDAAIALQGPDWMEAEGALLEAHSIITGQFGERHGAAARTASDLGLFYARKGDDEKAVAYLEQALASRESVNGPDHPGMIAEYSNLGNQYMKMKRHADARRVYAAAVPLALAEVEKTGADYNRLVAMTMADSLARACLEMDDAAAAIEPARTGVEMMLPLQEKNPADVTTAKQTSNCLHQLGTALRLDARAEEARAVWEQQLAVVGAAVEKPGSEDVALAVRKAMALHYLGRHEEADPILRLWVVERGKSNKELDAIVAERGLAAAKE